MSTFKDVVDGLTLDRTYPEHHGSAHTRPITEKERALQPFLQSVVASNWPQTLVSTHRAQYDQHVLSPRTLREIDMLHGTEERIVLPSWTQEEQQVEGFMNILIAAAAVVEDLLELPQHFIVAAGQVSRDACIADVHARTENDEILLTVEAQTPDALKATDWVYIAEQAAQGGSWSNGGFPVDVSNHAGSMLVQTWCQSIFESYTNSNSQTVTPRYCALTNYNKTLFGLRGSGADFITGDESTLFITRPLDRKETFLALVALLATQITVLERQTVSKARAVVHADRDFYAALTHPKDAKSEPADRIRDPDFSPHKRLTYTFNIRTAAGVPFMLTTESKTLCRGRRPEAAVTPPSLNPSSSWSKSSLLGDPSESLVPHLTIIAHLGKGVAGDAYLVESRRNLLVLKEVKEDDDVAWREASMYDGPLATLQGTVVPRFYGAYHKMADPHVVLLMEYVGQRIPGHRWEDVTPEIRLAVETQLRKVEAAGVSHGDFQPRNVCITDGGGIRIIDFSHSVLLSSPGHCSRPI